MSSASAAAGGCHHPQPHPQQQQQQPQPIPTYEIVTNAVVFSGYYYTPYVHHLQQQQNHQDAGGQAAFTMTPGQCLPCSCNQWAAQQLSQPQQS